MLQAIYGLGSERLLPEQLDYNMLYRWLVGLGADDPIWQHSSFRKDRERLLNEKVLALFPETLPGMEGVKPLVSSDHFYRRHPAGQGIPQLPQTCGWQHDPGQDGLLPCISWPGWPGRWQDRYVFRKEGEEGRQARLPRGALQQRHPASTQVLMPGASWQGPSRLAQLLAHVLMETAPTLVEPLEGGERLRQAAQ